jgi:hypothetical protein
MHFMDRRTTEAIKSVLSPTTKAKFAKTKPVPYKEPKKLLPVRGLTPDGVSVPLGISKKDKTIPIKKLSDGR